MNGGGAGDIIQPLRAITLRMSDTGMALHGKRVEDTKMLSSYPAPLCCHHHKAEPSPSYLPTPLLTAPYHSDQLQSLLRQD